MGGASGSLRRAGEADCEHTLRGLDSSGMGKQVLGGAVKALAGYDQIRDRAMTGYEQAENVRGALKKGGVL